MAWWLAALPALAAALVAGAVPRRRAALAGTACIALAATFALGVSLAVAGGGESSLAWGPGLRLHAALPPVAAAMAMLVPAIALPILAYTGVHEPETGLARLVALLLLFVGGMELLVIAADLLTLLLGWELVGACSWALIAHEWREAEPPRAGMYAFIATRLGDLGLFLAAMTAFAVTGSFAYAELGRIDGSALHLLASGLLLSAAAKSGQIPFAPWLFRAMAGPTPVSALLHAAAMVAAGAYLLIRLQPELTRAPWFDPAAVAVGLATALGGGWVALRQSHAKRLLAASTSAHYGLMFVAVGAGYPGVALLHLFAHAAFKALLFLAVGVLGAQANGFELHAMRNARRLPVVAITVAVGVLALAGVPPLGGGWTKEALTGAAAHADHWIAAGVVVAGALSAAYGGRLERFARGTAPGDGGRRYPPGTGALLALAGLNLALSVLWLPGAEAAISSWLGAHPPPFKPTTLAASLLAAAAGLYAGNRMAAREAARPVAGPAPRSADWLGLPPLIEAAVTRPVRRLASAAAWLDDHAFDAAPRAAGGFGRLARRAADSGERLADAVPRGLGTFGRAARLGDRLGERLADALPVASARLVGLGGRDARRLQTGLSHHYYTGIAVGAVVLVALLLTGTR